MAVEPLTFLFSAKSFFFLGVGNLVLANNPSEFFDFDGERFSWDGNLGVYHHRTLSLSLSLTFLVDLSVCLYIMDK